MLTGDQRARLVLRRVAMNMTQRELAALVGITQDTLNQLELGKREPRWYTLVKWSRGVRLEPQLTFVERFEQQP